MPIKNIGLPGTGKLRLPSATPNLSLLGVPESLQGRTPGVMSYPDKFNPDARWIWKKMFEKDDYFKLEIKAEENIDLQWRMAIVEFLRRCEQVGAVPFANVTQQELNDAVITSLTAARTYLKSFVDGIGLFDRIRLDTVSREYHIKERGTSVHSWATCKPIKDPTFEKWLTTKPNPGLVMSTSQKYTRLLQSNLLFWVRYVNSTRITVGFEIQVASPISVPGKRLATRKDIETFMSRTIWLPIVRAQRFKGLKSRLF